MGHRSSKQLEEAPSKAIIFQTIHLNNLSILNLKMKIFFALALVIVFPRSVVLDADCDSGDTVPEISDDCLSEFNNAVDNGKFEDDSDDTFKDRCSLCCTAFEYNHAGEESYKCGTYTGGESDKLTTETGGNSWSTEGYQKSTWTSCFKD